MNKNEKFCDMFVLMFIHFDSKFKKRSLILLFVIKLMIHFNIVSSILRLRKLWSNRRWKTLSKTSETSSKKTIIVNFFFHAAWIFFNNVCITTFDEISLRPFKYKFENSSYVFAVYVRRLININFNVFFNIFKKIINRYVFGTL